MRLAVGVGLAAVGLGPWSGPIAAEEVPDAAATDEEAPVTDEEAPAFTLDELTTIDERLWVEAPSRRRQPLATAPAAVRVLTDEDLGDAPALTLADRLRYVAGIDVYQHRHGQFDVGLRGFNSVNTPSTLATVDGQTFGFDQLGALFWSGYLHRTDLARVEIVKGPVSVSYGANAFGGVIAMRSREVGEELEVRTLAQGGEYGFREADATVLCPLPLRAFGLSLYAKASLGASARKDLPTDYAWTYVSDRHGHERTGDDDLRSLRYAATIGARLPGDSRLQLEYVGFDLREWGMIDRFTGTTDYARDERHGLHLRLAGDWGELLAGSKWARGWWNTEYGIYLPWYDYQYSAAGFDNRTDSVRLQLNRDFGSHTISAGGEYKRWRSRSNLWAENAYALDAATWGEVNRRNVAVFAEDQWRPHRNLVLSAGLRYDRDNLVGDNWSPRCAVNYALSATEFYRFSYSRGYRLPAPIELHLEEYFFGTDPDIRAETINAFEVGWQRAFEDTGTACRLNASYSRSNHHIRMVPLDPWTMEANWRRWLHVTPYGGATPAPIISQKPGPFFVNTNVDNPLDLWALEAELRQELFGGDAVDAGPRLELWANATWQDYRYRRSQVYASPGFPDPYVYGGRLFCFYGDLGRDVGEPPRWKANLGCEGSWRGWFFTGALRYVHHRDLFAIGDVRWLEGGGVGESRVGRYAALDLACGYAGTLLGNRVRAKLSVLNLGDDEHAESLRRSWLDLIDDEIHGYGARIGRQLGFSLEAAF